ncbi:DUF3072 domain-containing protein [Salipiger abyssi]|uniref:DUF3072 domain-containing protein n=1 Tax=Salipiger abyssi TaxID=1250539 RepID=UPI001A8C143E|nr:DUF3072 domain-containing protein [Salipiger abyssi]MBN9887543.1 DUF3072 domain-containing protein [Salipiger abyssi]
MNSIPRAEDVDAALDVPPPPQEPMTEEQEARLRLLSERSGESFDPDLTRREAERRIELLEDVAY